ncbi:MAG: hypothetical protein AB3A66_03030 [Nodularia sp. CChRGM 3473]
MGQVCLFKMGQAIALTGFRLDEAEPLAQILVGRVSNHQAVIPEILSGTGGQRFLT